MHGKQSRADKDSQRFRSFEEAYDRRERSPEELENKHDLVIDRYVLYCRKCWVYAAPTTMPRRAEGPIQPPPLKVGVCKAPTAGWKEAKTNFQERQISDQAFLNLRRGSDGQKEKGVKHKYIRINIMQNFAKFHPLIYIRKFCKESNYKFSFFVIV